MIDKLKKQVVRFLFWTARKIILEDKEKIAKVIVEDILEDKNIPEVRNINQFVTRNFPLRIGRRGF